MSESLPDTRLPETRSTGSQIESKRFLAARGSVSIKLFVTEGNGDSSPWGTESLGQRGRTHRLPANRGSLSRCRHRKQPIVFAFDNRVTLAGALFESRPIQYRDMPTCVLDQ